jgi:hypothetical protein
VLQTYFCIIVLLLLVEVIILVVWLIVIILVGVGVGIIIILIVVLVGHFNRRLSSTGTWSWQLGNVRCIPLFRQFNIWILLKHFAFQNLIFCVEWSLLGSKSSQLFRELLDLLSAFVQFQTELPDIPLVICWKRLILVVSGFLWLQLVVLLKSLGQLSFYRASLKLAEVFSYREKKDSDENVKQEIHGRKPAICIPLPLFLNVFFCNFYPTSHLG